MENTDFTAIVQSVSKLASEKNNEKELIAYLNRLDIDQLNRLGAVFDDPKKLNMIDIFRGTLAGTAFVGLIAAFPTLDDWTLMLGKIWVLILWSLIALIGVLLSVYNLSDRARINSSEKKIKIKKIQTCLWFVLDEKYKCYSRKD